MFDFLFKPRRDEHVKRAEIMLREANMARIEHQAAAEHHAALAQMYAERAARLEHEVYGSRPLPWRDEPALEVAPSEKVRPLAFGVERRVER